MQRFKARLKKLEKHQGKQGANRVLHYRPAGIAVRTTSPDLNVWQTGCGQDANNPASGPLRAFKGRFMLVPDFGTDVEWAAAIKHQQRNLLAVDTATNLIRQDQANNQ